MARCPHTSAKKGKRVVVTLNDGRQILDKFVERKSRHIRLQEHGAVATERIRALTIYRGQPLKSGAT